MIGVIASYVVPAIFVGLPLSGLIWIIIELVKLLKTPKRSEERETRKRAFVVSLVVAGIPIGVLICVAVLFGFAIANM